MNASLDLCRYPKRRGFRQNGALRPHFSKVRVVHELIGDGGKVFFPMRQRLLHVGLDDLAALARRDDRVEAGEHFRFDCAGGATGARGFALIVHAP